MSRTASGELAPLAINVQADPRGACDDAIRLGAEATALVCATAVVLAERRALTVSENRSSRPLNILHVIPSISAGDGGPSRAIIAMEGALTAAGVNVTTATTNDDGPSRRLRRHGSVAEDNGAKRIYFRKWVDFYKITPALVPWLWTNAQRFDVIHIHALFSFASVIAGVIARLRRVPYIVRPLGTLSVYGVTKRRPFLKPISLRLIDGPLLQGAAYVHCTSQSELDEARALGLRFNGGVIPLGVEQLVARRDAPKAAKAISPDGSCRTVLYLSRIDRKKNIEGLLDAFARIAQARRDVRLIIAGDGPAEYVKTLKARAASLAIDKRIEWPGHVEGGAKAAVLAAADIFVLPSYSENFGIAAVEAMLAGLPCILSDGVGVAREAGAAGACYVAPPEPRALAEAFTRLLDDAAARETIGRRAATFAQQEYSTTVMARRLIALYVSLARTGQERPA